MRVRDRIRRVLVPSLIGTILITAPSSAAENLCDPSAVKCRTQLLALVANERVGIDVAFWFMQDYRYAKAIVERWRAGVPVRILVDPRASPTYPGNSTMLDTFRQAGIPMRYRTASGILHWKLMLFAGQETVEFGSANYSPDAFVPTSPYSNYVSETIYYTNDPDVANSFKTKFDDAWTDTSSFANYANIRGALTRTYPRYAIDPELNFPPGQDFAKRSIGLFNSESRQIDAIMYRITDRRHADAMISAVARGVAVRLIVENKQYRDPNYLWDAWNVDRMYVNGVSLRWRGHTGENHEKVVLLYGHALTIFGSSNWTSASAASQAEHNYFTAKNWIFNWFQSQFNRMWFNSAGAAETVKFKPLPPESPKRHSPAGGTTVSGPSVTLTWYGGCWAHYYDIYFGTSPDPPLFAANRNLGPSATASTYQTFRTPPLVRGRTYYWKIVSKTMANVSAAGSVRSFTVR